MFEGPNYPTSLQESLFQSWLEQGRASKIGHMYLLVVWNVYDEKYEPVYVSDRESFADYEIYPNAKGAEALIAVYDLYSETRVSLS